MRVYILYITRVTEIFQREVQTLNFFNYTIKRNAFVFIHIYETNFVFEHQVLFPSSVTHMMRYDVIFSIVATWFDKSL